MRIVWDDDHRLSWDGELYWISLGHWGLFEFPPMNEFRNKGG